MVGNNGKMMYGMAGENAIEHEDTRIELERKGKSGKGKSGE